MTTVILEPLDIESKLLEFINPKGALYNYEKILMKEHYNRILEILKGKNPPPYEIEIQPTSKCNAHCNHCWAKDYTQTKDKLDNKNMNHILEQVCGFSKDGFKIETIKFCGSTGEPLMNPSTLYAINQLHKKRNLRLFTNGIKLAENKTNEDYLKSISKVNILNISLDAGTTRTLHLLKRGSKNIQLEDILEATSKIKNLSKERIDITVGYVITRDNYKEIIKATKKVRDSGADKIRFRINMMDRTVSQDYGNEINNDLEIAMLFKNENFDVIKIHSEKEVKEKKQNHFSSKSCGYECFTSRLWACIGSNGNLYPCGHIVAGDTKNYGNILEENLSKIWDGEERKKLIKKLPGPKCSLCSPFSLKTNRFLSFLSELPINKIKKFHDKYFKN